MTSQLPYTHILLVSLKIHVHVGIIATAVNVVFLESHSIIYVITATRYSFEVRASVVFESVSYIDIHAQKGDFLHFSSYLITVHVHVSIRFDFTMCICVCVGASSWLLKV